MLSLGRSKEHWGQSTAHGPELLVPTAAAGLMEDPFVLFEEEAGWQGT